jgi:hypothetical protein
MAQKMVWALEHQQFEKKVLKEILSIVYVQVEYTPWNMSNADEVAVVVAPPRL